MSILLTTLVVDLSQHLKNLKFLKKLKRKGFSSSLLQVTMVARTMKGMLLHQGANVASFALEV